MEEPEQGPEFWDTEEADGDEDWNWGDGSRRGHRRRLAMGTLTAVVACALLGGLLIDAVGGSSTRAVAAVHQRATRALNKSELLQRHEANEAAKVLLVLSDEPSGWAQSSGPITSTKTSAWSKPLAQCVRVPHAVVAAQPVKVTSPNFTSGDKTLAVEDSVSLYPSAREAHAQYQALASRRLPTCMNSIGATALASTVQSEVGSGATVGTVSIAPLTAGAYGPTTTGFTVSIPISASGGRQLVITSTEVDFAVGKVNQLITFNGNGTAFPVSLQQHLILTALGRL